MDRKMRKVMKVLIKVASKAGDGEMVAVMPRERLCFRCKMSHGLAWRTVRRLEDQNYIKVYRNRSRPLVYRILKTEDSDE